LTTELKVPVHMYIIFLLSCWLSHQIKYGKWNCPEHCFLTFDILCDYTVWGRWWLYWM